MSSVLRVKLTGRAAAFLKLLQDFGHLDDEGVAEIQLHLADMLGSPEETTVDLPVVRRFAAAMLFGDDDPEAVNDIETGVLAEDWPFLFS